MNRSDTHKLNREPVTVILGGNEYSISPKPLAFSRGWKAKAKPTIETFMEVLKGFEQAKDEKKTIQLQELVELLIQFLFEVSNQVVDLLFDWEKELPKDKILSEVYDETEIYTAFFHVVFFAFPLLQHLGINPASLQTMMSSMSNQ